MKELLKSEMEITENEYDDVYFENIEKMKEIDHDYLLLKLKSSLK